MQYRINPKNGDSISLLGLGCMRLPRSGNRIDQEKADEIITASIDCGINYFDSAYIYPGSEAALGTALAAVGKRDQVFIGTKLPHYMCRKNKDLETLFETQLQRLQTSRIDYYHMHMLSNTQAWDRLKGIGIENWIDKKRAKGSIRNIGFSFHGGREDFLRLLDAYDWGFCLVQFNYLDEKNQAGISGIRAAAEKGMAVFVMEPARGGMLATGLPPDAALAFNKADSKRPLAEWAFRWVFDHPEVTMALSGMDSVGVVEENSATAEAARTSSINEAERAAYKEAVAALTKSVRVSCTRCGYCMPCPCGVDIPECFSCYNNSYMLGRMSGIAQYMQVTGQTTPAPRDASKCTSCGKCVALCPQKINIPEELKRARRRLLSFIMTPLFRLARVFLRI